MCDAAEPAPATTRPVKIEVLYLPDHADNKDRFALIVSSFDIAAAAGGPPSALDDTKTYIARQINEFCDFAKEIGAEAVLVTPLPIEVA